MPPGWTKHGDKYCPGSAKYAAYTNVASAQAACDADTSCGFVYDHRCDGGVGEYGIELCHNTISAGQLLTHSPDCVYEIVRDEESSCPSRCGTCQAGGAGGGGTALTAGVCHDYCSQNGFCGTSDAYKVNGATSSTDCRGCAPAPQPSADPSSSSHRYWRVWREPAKSAWNVKELQFFGDTSRYDPEQDTIGTPYAGGNPNKGQREPCRTDPACPPVRHPYSPRLPACVAAWLPT